MFKISIFTWSSSLEAHFFWFIRSRCFLAFLRLACSGKDWNRKKNYNLYKNLKSRKGIILILKCWICCPKISSRLRCPCPVNLMKAALEPDISHGSSCIECNVKTPLRKIMPNLSKIKVAGTSRVNFFLHIPLSGKLNKYASGFAMFMQDFE